MRKVIPGPPQTGDIRIVEKFLFFPKTLRWEASYSGTRIRIWLETVYIKQVYSRLSWAPKHYGWKDEHFVLPSDQFV